VEFRGDSHSVDSSITGATEESSASIEGRGGSQEFFLALCLVWRSEQPSLAESGGDASEATHLLSGGRRWRIHCHLCKRPTNTRNISVTASYPWPVLAS